MMEIIVRKILVILKLDAFITQLIAMMRANVLMTIVILTVGAIIDK
jgi:hypothetical protein